MGLIYYIYLVDVMKAKAELAILGLKGRPEQANGIRLTCTFAHKYVLMPTVFPEPPIQRAALVLFLHRYLLQPPHASARAQSFQPSVYCGIKLGESLGQRVGCTFCHLHTEPLLYIKTMSIL